MTPLSYETASLKILLVDDEAAIRNLLRELLSQDGHAVGVAADGAAALANFHAENWDVVITDRHMPGMDGETLAREIKNLSPRTPVIMITGFAPARLCSSVDCIVHKPFNPTDIAAAISRCLAAVSLEPDPSEEGFSAAA